MPLDPVAAAKLEPSQARRCLSLAHRDISLRREVRSLSGHSGHGRACWWLDLGRE